VSDSAWIAQLMMNGVLRPSFIPPQPLEELRMLARYRVKQVQAKNATKNRIIKLAEAEGIKLASVVSDVLGKSGRAMLEALIEGTSSPAQIAELARGALRNKREALMRALSHPLNDTARWILRRLLDELRHQEARIEETEAQLSKRLDASYEREVALLKQIPGISDVAAAVVVAEVGADMSVFPTAQHLASWGGLAPGAHQSAGKSRKAAVRPGNPWLRTILVHVAQVLARKKDSPWRAFFHRTIRNTANYNKAILAVARKIAVTIFYVLRDGAYRPPEPRPLRSSERARLQMQAVTQLQKLGFQVTLSEAMMAA
jgi:transposase